MIIKWILGEEIMNVPNGFIQHNTRFSAGLLWNYWLHERWIWLICEASQVGPASGVYLKRVKISCKRKKGIKYQQFW